MRLSVLICIFGALACTAGDKKKAITNEAGNDNLDIVANPLTDADSLKAALGMEMPAGIIAVEVKLVPKGDSPVSINRDDFILLSHKDGQRSEPYSPSQIAGSATMVVRSQSVNNGGGIGRNRTGPVWGGIPGVGGRPRQMDDGNGGVGNTAANETKTTAEIKDDKPAKENPLLKVLDEKMLQDKEITEPVKGLLYFPLDGKVKTKDLELIYKGPAGRLYIDFR